MQTANSDTVSLGEAAQILGMPGDRVAALVGERRLTPAGLLDGQLHFRREEVQWLSSRCLHATHHHAVQFYESESFLIDVVTDFVHEGLKARAPIVLIARPARLDAVLHRLQEDGRGGAEALRAGQMTLLDAHEQLSRFMIDGRPDGPRFRRCIEPLMVNANRLWPGARLRAYGEMVDILWEQGLPEAALQLEDLWNELARDRSFALLCGYGMARFSSDRDDTPFSRVCATHSDVLPSEVCGHAASLGAQRREMARMQRRIQQLEAQVVAPAPAAAAAATPSDPNAANDARTGSPGGGSGGESGLPAEMTVLVVDDDLPSRRLLIEALHDMRRPRIAIIEARSLDQALSALDTGSPDLCITDFRLCSGQTGLDLFLAARARGSLAPFVGITGAFVEDDLAETLLSSGFEDVLLKQHLNEANLYRIIRNAGLRGRNLRKLMAIGTIDELTGVLNRRGYLERLESERLHCERQRQTLSVLYLDLDDMKSINDRWGHRAGDEALRTLVGSVQPLLRKSDLIGRLGGDEFSVALPGTDAQDALAIVRRLRDVLRGRPFVIGEATIEACVSVGVYTVENAGSVTTSDLIERADAAMFKDKSARRAERRQA